MTDPLNHTMTCEEFQAILPDYLQGNTLGAAARVAAGAHLRDCVDCAALVTDLRVIIRDAGELPVLTPSRDLWSGIESRIESPVVSLTARITGEHVVPDFDTAVPMSRATIWDARRLAIAASLLVAVSAGATYWAVGRSVAVPTNVAATERVTATARGNSMIPIANRPTAEQTFDREIAELHNIVRDRRADLDSTTIAVIEKNLIVIDNAIAESKAALAKNPASAFLADRLNHAYDSKLQVLRDVAKMSARS